MRTNHGYRVEPLRLTPTEIAFGANTRLRWQVRGPWPLHGTAYETREQAEAVLASLLPCRCGEWHLPHAPILANEGHGVPD